MYARDLPQSDMAATRVLVVENIHHVYHLQFCINYPEERLLSILSALITPSHSTVFISNSISSILSIAKHSKYDSTKCPFSIIFPIAQEESLGTPLLVYTTQNFPLTLVHTIQYPHHNQTVPVKQRRVSGISKSKQVLLQPLHAWLHRIGGHFHHVIIFKSPHPNIRCISHILHQVCAVFLSGVHSDHLYLITVLVTVIQLQHANFEKPLLTFFSGSWKAGLAKTGDHFVQDA